MMTSIDQDERRQRMPYSYGLAEHGTTLATRPFAKEIREDLLEKAVGQKVVELNFDGVRSTSHSFADEFVARLAEDSKLGSVDFELTVSGASEEVGRVVNGALERRGIKLPEPV
jgi:hypothetical protein